MSIRRPMVWRLFCSHKMEKVGWIVVISYRDYLILIGVKKKLRGYKYHTEK